MVISGRYADSVSNPCAPRHQISDMCYNWVSCVIEMYGISCVVEEPRSNRRGWCFEMEDVSIFAFWAVERY